MSNFSANVWLGRTIVLVFTVVVVVGAAPRLAAGTPHYDKYGNRIITPEDTQEKNNAQFQADKANWEALRNRSRAAVQEAEANADRLVREAEQQERAKAEAAQQADARRAEIAAQRAAERARDNAIKELKQTAWEAEVVRFEGEYMSQKEATERTVVRIAEALQCLRSGKRYVLPTKATRMIEDFIRGVAYTKDFSELRIACTEAERFAIALDLYRQCDPTALSNEIDIMGATVAGRGRLFVDAYLAQCADKTNPANGSANRWRYGYDQGWVALACALAAADGKLDAEQRHLAASLLADAINGLPPDPYPAMYGKSTAALMVAAAQQAPELAQSPRIQQTYIPLVKACIWKNAFKSYPVPIAGAAPLVTTELSEMLWWGLATRLVLADGSVYPGTWFAQVREARRTKRGDPLSAAAKQTLQRALDSWFTRAKASPWLRQALQADFDLACAPPVQKDPKHPSLTPQEDWDRTIIFVADETMRGEGIRDFYDKEALNSSATGFLLHSGAANMERAIDRACAVSFGVKVDGYGLWNTVQMLTNFQLAAGEKLPDLGISLDHWRALVIAGEAPNLSETFTYFDAKQKPPVPSKDRLRQIRREILGETAGELVLPEYSRKPADLHESLLKLTEQSSMSDDEKPMTTELRAALQGLLAHVENVVDPATVLTIAEIQGRQLGDWAQLGAWLDDPRRRPKDKTNPLYFPYLIATMARDQASGYWNTKSFDVDEPPTNETERRMHQTIQTLISELAEPIDVRNKDAAKVSFRTVLRSIKQLGDDPGMRPLLAPIIVGASSRIYAAVEEYHNATGTAREYETSLKPYPEIYQIQGLAALVVPWKEISPKLRVRAAVLMTDRALNYSEKPERLALLDGFVTSETDPLADPVAQLAGLITACDNQEQVALVRRALLRATKIPRDTLVYASPWESIPAFAVEWYSDAPAATVAALAAFEKAPVGSRERAQLVNQLVAIQLQADVADPLERSAEKALYVAARAKTDDGVAALAYATLIRREHNEISWAYPPASRLATDVKSLSTFSFRDKEDDWYARSREANGFAALVFAYQKKVPGARTRLIELYDPALDDETRFALGSETCAALGGDSGDFAQIGTRARLAAVGTTDAAGWLQRVTALPSAEDEAGLATLYVNAVRGHSRPEMITAELLRMVWHQTAGNAERAALRTLIADAAAPRFFGAAWHDDSPSPFKPAWMLTILDQKAAEQLPVPDDDFSRPLEAESKKLLASVPEGTDVPEEIMAKVSAISEELGNHRVAYQEQKMRERMRGLSPKTVMLLAFSSARTTSELARAIVHDEPSGFIDNLVKFAVENDPSLQTLSLRYSSSSIVWKPLTAEHWALLSEGKLWPLPQGISEAN